MGYEAFGDAAFGDEAFGDAALGDEAFGGTLSRGEEFDLTGDLGGEVVDLAGDVEGMGSLRVSLGKALALPSSFMPSFVTFDEKRGNIKLSIKIGESATNKQNH